MSRGGIPIQYGGLSPEPTPFPLFTVLAKTPMLRGQLVHEVTSDPAWLEAAKAFILDRPMSGSLKPVIEEQVRRAPGASSVTTIAGWTAQSRISFRNLPPSPTVDVGNSDRRDSNTKADKAKAAPRRQEYE